MLAKWLKALSAPNAETVLHRGIVLLAHEVVVPEGVVWPEKNQAAQLGCKPPAETDKKINSQAVARVHHP